jgi:molybdate transport system ATP-binding protein
MMSCHLRKRLQAASGEIELQLDLDLAPGTLLGLYGASGAGKTSTLRMLAGLMRPDAGQIVVNEKVWLDTDRGIDLSPRNRSVGFVFQDYALFPNMTVRQNLEFALPRGGDPRIVSRLIDAVELNRLSERRPGLLSGGQQQRVALARALVQQPHLLLLDEPLSALDAEMRQKLQQYLIQVHRDFGLTTILVSHDQNEVRRLADEVVVLEDSRIVRQGTPEEVFGGKGQSVWGQVRAIEPDAETDDAVILHLAVPRRVAEGLQSGNRIEISPRRPSSGGTPTP